MSRARELSRLGNPNIIKADNDYNVGFGTLTPRAKGDFVGVVSATSFYGDGSTLTGVAAAGIGTALSDEKTNPLNQFYFTNQTFEVGVSTTIDAPTSANVAYTQAAEIEVADGIDLTVADGDSWLVDVLGISSDPILGGSVDNNLYFDTLYGDEIRDKAGTGSPNVPYGLRVGGATTLSGALSATGAVQFTNTTESTNSATGALIVSGGVGIAKSLHVGGNVSIGGTLTYEDVTNIDVVGLATYRSGAEFGVAGVGGTIRATGDTTLAGVVTATSFVGDLTGDVTGNVTATNVIVSGITTVSTGSSLAGYKVEEGKQDGSTGLNGEFDYKLEDGHIQRFSAATGGNYFPDFKVSSGTTLSSIMGVGDVVSVTLIVASSSHYCTTGVEIDNSTSNIDLDWVGGSAPSAANGSGFDIYAFTIMKTAATPAYHIIGNAIGVA